MGVTVDSWLGVIGVVIGAAGMILAIVFCWRSLLHVAPGMRNTPSPGEDRAYGENAPGRP